MKRFSVVGLLVILSMVLAACGGGSQQMTPTGVGGLEPGPVGTDVVDLPTDEPMATEAPLATDVVVEPTVAGTVMGTNIPATGDEDNNRLSNLMDFTVVDAQDNELGGVDDMVIDASGTQVQYVIVGAGGFLGIGERDVLIPWNMLEVGTTANNDAAFIFSGDADALQNFPDVVVEDFDFTDPAWDADIDTYWANPGAVSGTPVGTSVVDGVEPTMDAMEPTVDAMQPTADAGMTDSNFTRGDAVNFVLASKLLVADVVDTDVFETGDVAGTAMPDMDPTAVGDTGMNNGTPMPGDVDTTAGTPVAGMDTDVIGVVVDAILDPAAGTIDYLIVDADDALNLGDVWIPVPMSQVELVYKGDADGNFVVLLPTDRLSQAPSFEVDMLPNTSTADWDADLVTYWGVTR